MDHFRNERGWRQAHGSGQGRYIQARAANRCAQTAWNPGAEIARVIGISDRAVRAAFVKALRRQTEDALDAWHRIELGGLAMEAANM